MSEENTLEAAELAAPETEVEEQVTAEEQVETVETPEPEPQVTEDEEPAWFKKRIDRFTRQKYELESQVKAKDSELAKIKAELEQLKNPAPTLPDINQYSDINEYQRDMAAYSEALAERAVQKYQKPQVTQPELPPEVMTKARELMQQGRSSLENFDEVISQAAISPDMVSLLVESDKGAEIAYYLGKNPTHSVDISAMTPTQAAMEIGKIEASLAKPKPKSTSAPPPPNVNKGGAAEVSVDPSKLSTEEWAAKRRAGQI